MNMVKHAYYLIYSKWIFFSHDRDIIVELKRLIYIVYHCNLLK